MGSIAAQPAPRIDEPFTVVIRVRKRRITLKLNPETEDGGFVVTSPTLRGLNTQGDSVSEAIANGHEAALALLTEPRRGRRP